MNLNTRVNLFEWRITSPLQHAKTVAHRAPPKQEQPWVTVLARRRGTHVIRQTEIATFDCYLEIDDGGFMDLIRDGLRIRNAISVDAETLCNWWNDGKIMAHVGFPKGVGTDIQQIIESLQKDNEDGRRLIIESNSVAIGEMNYRTISEGVAEIGIKICVREELERGLGTKCIQMLLRYLFVERGYKKIILDANLQNTRAQHVYEKIGFIKVATNIDSWINQLGELQSSIDYELCREAYYAV